MKDLEVISKVVKINNSDENIYAKLSDMRNFSRFVPPEVNDWTADENSCSFVVQNKTIKLQIVEKTAFKLVKISSDENSSDAFTLWVQLQKLEQYVTAARIVAHVKANLLVRNLIKGKLQEGMNQIAEMLKYL